MAEQEVADVAVVGGGVIGIASAVCLRDAGFSVLLIDRDEPGTGCSAGNAGVIATSYVLPLSSISHILGAPRMLVDEMAPLSLPWRHLGSYAPWLCQFALNALPNRRRRSIEALKRLNGEALAAWKRLLGGSMASRFLIERGMLDVVASGRSLDGLRAGAAQLRAEGVRVDLLGPEEVSELEPALDSRIAGAAFHSGVAQVADPLLLSRALLDRFVASGGQVARLDVEAVAAEPGGVRVVAGGQSLRARNLLITAGFWSPRFVEPFGLRAPLRAERGYHLMLPAVTGLLDRPVSFHAESFLATPMEGGLRLAGTVELAPPDARPDWRRADNLLAFAGRYFPGLEQNGQSRWLGSRPSFADSLPAIGAVRGAGQIVYAFGHQHLGLTQAAVTAEYVREIIRGSMPHNIDSFSLERFGAPRGRADAVQERAA